MHDVVAPARRKRGESPRKSPTANLKASEPIKAMPLYIRHLPGKVSAILDREGLAPNVVCFNPSRAAPYTYIRTTVHTAVDETNRILLHNDENGEVWTVEYDMAVLAPTANLYKGLEDLRIVRHESGDRALYFTATTTHASPHMTNEMVVGRFSADARSVALFNVVDIGSRPVKNVVPFFIDGELALLDVWKSKIYYIEEAKTTDEAGPAFAISRTQPLTWAAGAPCTYRGSTSPIHLHGNTWGCVVHDMIFNDSIAQALSYLHYWLEFEVDGPDRCAVTFVSTAFWVAHWGIEYVSGIERRPDGRVRLFFGITDNNAAMCETTLFDLRAGK
jgi:hypothetical protein